MRSTLTEGNRPEGGTTDPRSRDLGVPEPGPLTIVVGGLVVPLLLILYGLSCIVSQQVGYWAYNTNVLFYGSSAIAIGVGFIAVAGFVHCQLFWDSLYDSTLAGARSKITCLILIGICAYYICFRCSFPG